MDYKEYKNLVREFQIAAKHFRVPGGKSDVKRFRTVASTVMAIEQTHLMNKLILLEVVERAACHKELPREFLEMDERAVEVIIGGFEEAQKVPQQERAKKIGSIRREINNTLAKLICRHCGGLRDKKIVRDISCPVRCNCY